MLIFAVMRFIFLHIFAYRKHKQAVITAVKSGYRSIDCANDYGNEHVIGEALQELFRDGVVKREDLFIQVKYYSLKTKNTPKTSKKPF